MYFQYLLSKTYLCVVLKVKHVADALGEKTAIILAWICWIHLIKWTDQITISQVTVGKCKVQTFYFVFIGKKISHRLYQRKMEIGPFSIICNFTFKNPAISMSVWGAEFMPTSFTSIFVIYTFHVVDLSSNFWNEQKRLKTVKKCFNQLSGACITQKLVKIHKKWLITIYVICDYVICNLSLVNVYCVL